MADKNKHKKSHPIKKWTQSFACCFALATVPAHSMDNKVVEEPHYDPIGLWKLNMFDVVVNVEKCPEKEFCPTIHWIAPNEKDIYSWFGPRKKKRKQKITREIVSSLCGQNMPFNIKPIKKNVYKGTIYARAKDTKLKVKMTMLSQIRVKVKISWGFFSKKDTWKKVSGQEAKLYPKCTPLKVVTPVIAEKQLKRKSLKSRRR